MNYLVYKHTSPSGKSYIGYTKDYNKRCAVHRQPASGCIAFYRAIQLYGWDSFDHEILAENLSFDQATALEIQLIAEHGTLAPGGYNLRAGGQGSEWSEESRRRVSEKRKGMKFSDKTRAIMSAQRKGRDKGKPKPGVSAAQSLTWVLTTPTGEELIITNLTKFCKQNGLTQPCMIAVAKGKQKQHRGWLCRKLIE